MVKGSQKLNSNWALTLLNVMLNSGLSECGISNVLSVKETHSTLTLPVIHLFYYDYSYLNSDE